MSPVLGTAKAAKWLGLGERAVRDMCAKGKLEGAYQPSGYEGKWLIPVGALQAIRRDPVDPSLTSDSSDSSDSSEIAKA